MATQTPKRTRAKFVSKQTVEQVGVLLQELPEKTPGNHSLRQAVEQLRDTIETALAKGYSYEDLVPILSQQGIDIQPSTLKRYILTGGTRSTAKRSGQKTRQTRKKQASSTTAEDAPETTEAPAPTATRKKRTKAAAEEAPADTPATAPRKRGRAAAKVASPPTATETAEAAPEPSKRRSRQTASASTAKTKSRTTSSRGRKTAKA